MIPIKNLSVKQISTILRQDKIFSGGEASIYESDDSYTLYKIFSKYNEVIPMGENKEKKISILYNLQLNSSVKPISLISVDDMIVGYEMSTDFDLLAYKRYQLSDEEILYLLKESKGILEYFKSKGVIYADVDFRNILFNRDTGEIQFCDMDNVKIDNYPIDKLPFSLIEYDSIRGIDQDVPAFMHNRLVLNTFELDMICSTNYSLKKHLKRPALKIVSSMRNIETFNGEYIVPYVKKHK